MSVTEFDISFNKNELKGVGGIVPPIFNIPHRIFKHDRIGYDCSFTIDAVAISKDNNYH